MGFLTKGIGKLVDALDDVTNGASKELSKNIKGKAEGAEKFATSAWKVAKEVYTGAYQKANEGIGKSGKFIDEHRGYVNVIEKVIVNCPAENIYVKIAKTIIILVKRIIDIVLIIKEVKKKYPNAFHAKILEKKKNAVKVGIFDDDRITRRMTIQSDEGVSEEVYRGQIIEIYD
ncbi:MAG TPA: hypothetical protein DDY68_06110 [Porphyromonadaceae bacterium]|nr:hypothetical protein [Porphyromonadaceae bacterium]